ncbi:vasoactive intestinal polypeptide receptor 2 isoform X3 [Pongo pygmaeus]|uniref:vasoactive intestinal polypeptide receptor 2 isoform X3 n=1 Tax=Pongo pygmaeus TaxID=9600 RepID=UPI0023E1A4CA|nr:vasoactive intestinal polypeptide receptor 2 isoform X3 [Pongo pygmaeus]
MPLWEAPSDHPANPPTTLQGHTSLPGCQEEPGRDPQSSLPQITSESSSISEGSLPSWSSGPAGAKLGASPEGIGLSDGNGDSKAATDRVGSAMGTVLRKHPEITFYILVKAIYTLGYSVSLMSLATGSIILCLFRKLHCTRNYIHLNLFLSFILRAISVLVKDDVLYSSSGTLHCPDQPSSWVGCKLSLVFLQYCIMANFFWLLVEGLYLHTLLVAMLPPRRCFLAYLLIGWGLPTVCIGAWTAARLYLEDTGCWDTNDHSVPWWVIRIPILISIIVNFVLFISIIRILLQKLTSPDVGGNDQSQYKRLAKSTLLLIPLFGVHYMVFAVFPISISSKYQILFELCLGSFQGLVVAILYCFLNSEVQCELKRKWRSRCPTPSTSRDYRVCGSSFSRNGSEGALQLHRGSRAQSFLQTETSVI